MDSFNKKRKREHSEDDNLDTLLMSLDFGTTYSGISYCFGNNPDPKPVCIIHWPGTRGLSMPKIPTKIMYGSETDDNPAWGALAEQKGSAIVGIKLLLDPSQARPVYLPHVDISKQLQALPKPPKYVAADFIKAIYSHALKEIAKQVPRPYFELCQKRFVLTGDTGIVPAVWSDAAKNATLEAASIAGMHPVTLIKEPEAAALYAAKSLNFAIGVGDAFVVCDAGGGTVDLISYEVETVSPTLGIKELVPGTGGRAGSMGLNERFSAAIQALVGEAQWAALQGTPALAKAQNQFDREIKRSFGGEDDEEYFVSFPRGNLKDDHPRGLQDNVWRITTEEMRDIFEPLVKDIVGLVRQQVANSRRKRHGLDVAYILLVGGFGSSQYLRQALEKEFQDIQVLQPSDAWEAIVKGAVLSQMQSQVAVISTCASKHYGVEAGEDHDPNTDAGEHVYRGLDGNDTTDRMTWYIKVSDDLTRDQKIRIPFQRFLAKGYTADQLIFTEEIYQCQDIVAPIHRSKSTGTTINCTLESDLRGISKKHIKSMTNSAGAPIYSVGYDIVLTMKSAMPEFSLEINGKTRGSVKTTFD